MSDIDTKEDLVENPFMAHVEREESLNDHEGRSEAEQAELQEAKHDPRDDITKQIADHEEWMADHTDDARGVQERLQEVAVLQRKVAEMDAVQNETRVRQMQTV